MKREGDSIRQAQLDDAEAIAQVHVQSWRETYQGIVPAEFLDALSVEKRAASWRKTLANLDSASVCLVATDTSGKVCGFVHGGKTRDEGEDGEIFAIYLLRKHQKCGLGRRLWQEAVAFLRERGHRALHLWVLADNAIGREFYRKAGGRQDGEKVIRIGDVELVELRLTWEVTGN